MTYPIVPKEKATPQRPAPTDEEQLQQFVELRKQVQAGPIQADPDLLRTIDHTIDDLRARIQRAAKRRGKTEKPRELH